MPYYLRFGHRLCALTAKKGSALNEPTPQVPAVEHFRVGDWIVYPKENALASDAGRVSVEPRAMETLEFLAYNAGTVVTPERLLVECGADLSLGDNPVQKAIAQLRKALGDSAVAPRYIETIRKRGYRLIAPVTLPAGYRGPVAQAAAPATPGSPFRGLDAFDSDDAAVFFGRSAAVETLVQALEAQWQQQCAFVLLVGASGSGKSSLLNAGLIPRLAPPGVGALDVVAIARVPGRGPGTRTLAAAVADALVTTLQPALLEGHDVDTWQQSLQHTPERALQQLADRIRSAQGARQGDRAPALVLVIDQLDDFFAEDGDPAQATQDAALLGQLACSGHIAVVAACRSSAYPALASVPGLLALKQPSGHVDLAPPGPAEIAEIIRRPAQLAALSFEEGPDGRLDDVLRDSAVAQRHGLPLLQHTLQLLYEHRQDGGRLGFAAYTAIGGLEGALRQHAEKVMAGVSPAARNSLPNVLVQLVRYSADGEQISCVAAPLQAFAPGPERELVDALLRNRLLAGTAEDNAPSVQIAHETLLRAWPRAAQWVADNRDDLHLRERLHLAAQRWQQEDQRRDLLLPGGRLLDEARELLRRRPQLLDGPCHALVAASAQREQRQRWVKRGAIGTVSALAVVAMAGFGIAHHARLQAEQDRERAAGLVEYMLGDLTDRLEQVGRLDLLDEVGTRIQHDLAGADARSHDTRLERSRVLRQLARIRVARGVLDDAAPLASESLALAQQVAREQPDSADAQLNLGESHYWNGYLAFLRNDTAGALQRWNAYRVATERATVLQPDNSKAWLEASYALNNLGTLARSAEQNAQSLQLFQQSLQYKRRAQALNPDDVRLRADLADSLSWVASAHDRLGQWPQARIAYDEAVSVITQVRERAPQDAEWKHREAVLHTLRGQILSSLGEREPAHAELVAATRLLDQIGEAQPDRSDWARDRSVTHRTAGELALDVGNLPDATAHFVIADRLLGALLESGAEVRELPRLKIRSALGAARLAHAAGQTGTATQRLAQAQGYLDEMPPTEKPSRRERLLRAETSVLRAELDAAHLNAHTEQLRQAALWLGNEEQRATDREARDLWQRLAPLLAQLQPAPPLIH
ncbi:winged helix-turn-helix domain-containing protein [Stenotrophomonas sp.]|uniref:nSTAND1 domain-containing NTPase n=1 Tax=Stenotrophomonas sp. TaxID=69392 RepID=UPI00289EA42F|nr:winged helix-turn-helix domain-containing protein [Stenotrophomonas sp.]